ncbi:MAG: AbrB/MazE/SpoVT family DNA-binding domain-containing protein [Acidobacteria bacterium]|nr:AbrB/MazE/SpoVT family DNA-binding domain-containing protein [Acidobacteriota bacterium]
MTVTLTSEMRSILPVSLRRKAGFRVGDQVEVKETGGILHIIPLQPAADEYTPRQRAIIDAELDEAQKGPFHGPFNSAGEMIAHMKGELKRRAASKGKRHLR